MPDSGSVMILADLQEGNRLWKSETRTYSLTSGPRSPTKMLYSGPRSSLRSAKPPPEAQFSLNGRCELGICCPFKPRALAAAWGDEKSTKQYPALLLLSSQQDSVVELLSTYPENLSLIIFTETCSPIWNQRLRMKFSSTQGSSSPILCNVNSDCYISSSHAYQRVVLLSEPDP